MQSFEDFQMAQQHRMTSLRAAIEEARAEYDKGRGIPFDQAAVKKIAAAGRRLMSARDRKR